MAWHGMAIFLHDNAWHGMAWHDTFLSMAWHDMANISLGMAWHGMAISSPGMAWHGMAKMAWQRMAPDGNDSMPTFWHGMA